MFEFLKRLFRRKPAPVPEREPLYIQQFGRAVRPHPGQPHPGRSQSPDAILAEQSAHAGSTTLPDGSGAGHRARHAHP